MNSPNAPSGGGRRVDRKPLDARAHVIAARALKDFRGEVDISKITIELWTEKRDQFLALKEAQLAKEEGLTPLERLQLLELETWFELIRVLFLEGEVIDPEAVGTGGFTKYLNMHDTPLTRRSLLDLIRLAMDSILTEGPEILGGNKLKPLKTRLH